MQDVNSVTLVGRLTRDPELRNTAGGTSVASMRLAYTQSRRAPGSGEWVEEPGFIDVTVFGNQADTITRFLSKGRQVVVQGRLDFRQWEDRDGNNRSATQIVANQVQFIGGNESGGGQSQSRSSAPRQQANTPVYDDDDIPF